MDMTRIHYLSSGPQDFPWDRRVTSRAYSRTAHFITIYQLFYPPPRRCIGFAMW